MRFGSLSFLSNHYVFSSVLYTCFSMETIWDRRKCPHFDSGPASVHTFAILFANDIIAQWQNGAFPLSNVLVF